MRSPRRSLPEHLREKAEELSLDPGWLSWCHRHLPALLELDLTVEDVHTLHGSTPAHAQALLPARIQAGRMGDVAMRWVHWWAASGLLFTPGPSTGWVTQARRFITAAGGDQELAAVCAAAGMSAEEVAAGRQHGTMDKESVRVLAALRASALTDGTHEP